VKENQVMAIMNKRATIYLEPKVHRALRFKAAETNRSISALVNDAVRQVIIEDAEDLAAFEERGKEPVTSFEAVLKELRREGYL
jgi:hypothetical protein